MMLGKLTQLLVIELADGVQSGVTVSCSWTRIITLTVPPFTQCINGTRELLISMQPGKVLDVRLQRKEKLIVRSAVVMETKTANVMMYIIMGNQMVTSE